jgi:protein-S-isoprenylcysteine O-methyltransferase Ste14
MTFLISLETLQDYKEYAQHTSSFLPWFQNRKS